jgi:hypothetical protein
MISFTGEVKLTDFGIARHRAREYQTEQDTARGQPLYMPLEQLDGQVDGRTDLFALGGVVFELLAGRLAFGDGLPPPSVHSAVLLKVNDTRISLGAARPDLPPQLISLVDRMLAKNPDDRPSSAQEALDVICTFPGLATGARSLQLVMEQLFPSHASIAAIPIDSPLRASRASGVPALRESLPSHDANGAADATIPDQVRPFAPPGDATSPGRANVRTGVSGRGDVPATNPSLLVVGDDVSAPPIDSTRPELRENASRGVPAWAVAMAAAVIMGGSAVAITAMRKRGEVNVAAPAVTSTRESVVPTVVAAPTQAAAPSGALLAPSEPMPIARAAEEQLPPPQVAAVAAPATAIGTHTQSTAAHVASAPTTNSIAATAASNTPAAASPSSGSSASATGISHPSNEGDSAPTASASAPAPQPTGTLRVIALPWGEVIVDGTARGRAPVTLRVAAGEHTVRITGGVEHTERVVVAANATRTVMSEAE